MHRHCTYRSTMFVLIVCTRSHIAARTMSVIVAVVWQSVGWRLHWSHRPVDYPLGLHTISVHIGKVWLDAYDAPHKLAHNLTTCPTCAVHDGCQCAHTYNLSCIYIYMYIYMGVCNMYPYRCIYIYAYIYKYWKYIDVYDAIVFAACWLRSFMEDHIQWIANPDFTQARIV